MIILFHNHITYLKIGLQEARKFAQKRKKYFEDMSLAHDHHNILILSHTNPIQTCQNIINVYKMFNDNHSKVILALQHRLITVYQYNSAKITTSPSSPARTLSLINKKLDNFLEIFFFLTFKYIYIQVHEHNGYSACIGNISKNNLFKMFYKDFFLRVYQCATLLCILTNFPRLIFMCVNIFEKRREN